MLRLLPLLILSALILTGCDQQSDPQTVTRLFWEAVVKNDHETMQKLATAESADRLELLKNNDQELQSVKVGEARINGKQAQVDTVLQGASEDDDATSLETQTWLVQHGEIWEIDADKTINTMMAAAVESMVTNLGQNIGDLGRQLSDSLSKGVQDFSAEINKSVPEINRQLKQLQESEKFKELGQQLGKAISDGLQEFSTELEKGLEELVQELEKATDQPEAPAAGEKI